MKRALVIDDEFAALEMLASALEAEGFEVEKAADGLVALARLEAGVFDLVLCDAGVSGVRKERLLATVREHATMHAVPFVLLAHRFERHGLHDVIVLEKPVRWPRLREVLALVRDHTP